MICEQAVNPAIKRFLEQHPGDYRIANLDYPNTALSLHAQDVWGYEPGVVLRYAQLLAFAQGLGPDQAVSLTTLHNAFWLDHPLLSMLRCRFLFAMQDSQLAIHERTNYLPHVLLVPRCRVLTDRDEIFSALTNAAFDPRQEVILETAPDPLPVVSAETGTVRLVESSTDYLTIEADLPAPKILLVPDVYAKGWRARALPGSSQTRYSVQPANWCLRALPLAAGHHRLRLEYAPLGFRLGRWVSLMFLPVFLILVALKVRRLARQGVLPEPATHLQAGRGGGTAPDEGRFGIASATGLAAAALLALWPAAGRDFLGYGDACAPLAGLFLLLAWSAQKVARRWRHQVWRLSVFALAMLALCGALVHRQIGYWRKSKTALSRPLTTAQNQGLAHDKAGEALLKQGRLDEAISHFEELLKENPDSAGVHQGLAVALLRKGRPDDALAHLQRAVQIDPRLASAHNSLGNLLLQRGQLDEASAHYQAAIDVQPGNAMFLNNLAWVLATSPQAPLRNGARAVELAEQSDRLSGGKNPSILETLAAAYAEAGRPAQAVATAQHALELATAQTNAALLSPLRSQIELYQAGSPFRDTSLTNVAPRPR